MESTTIVSTHRWEYSRRVRGALRRAISEDSAFLLAVIAYVVAASTLKAVAGVPADLDLRPTWGQWRLTAGSTGLLAVGLFLLFLVREVVTGSGSVFSGDTWKLVATRTFPPDRTLNYAVIVLTLPTLSTVFAAFKISIVDFVPFGIWDLRLAEWDRVLHMGYHPWELLQPLLGHPLVTKALDLVYYTWFPVVWMTLIWQAWHGRRDTPDRSQFLLAFALCWILLGTIGATLMSSAGPVYFSNVTGVSGPYQGLLNYLAEVDAYYSLSAVKGHELLWASFVSEDPAQFSGISAMPSLHVSIATLLAILGFRVDRRLGWLYTAFAFLILVGSVHLAWHYAVDGYVAVAGTCGIWWLSGWLVRRTRPAFVEATG